MARSIRLSDCDNILLLVGSCAPGEVAGDVTARTRSSSGHKMAAIPIPEGAEILNEFVPWQLGATMQGPKSRGPGPRRM